MKKIAACFFLFLSAAAAPSFASAQEKPGQIGAGIYLGIPFGFTAKYLMTRDAAVDMALGIQGSNFDGHADILTHFRDLPNQPVQGTIAPYIGAGIKLEDQAQILFGFRLVGGVSYIPSKTTPIEIFGELAPVLRVSPSTGTNLDGGVGLRYYF